MSKNTRIPPQALDAEEYIISSILLDNESINFVADKISPKDFYSSSFKEIYTAMAALSDKSEPIDIITLSAELKKRGSFEQAGGMDNLGRLSTLGVSSANISYYSNVVKEMSIRRSFIHEASNLITDAFDSEKDITVFLDSMEQRVLGIADEGSKKGFTPISELVQDTIKLVEKMYDKKDPVTGVSSGFTDLDRLTSGLQASDLIILAARPAMGKTSLAMTIAQYIGIHERRNVAVFSLEMSKEQLVMRALCSEARVGNQKVRTGHLGERDFPRLVDAASRIAEAPIFIDDTPALTVSEFRAKARRLHREHPIALIVLDYLQLMRSPSYEKNREQEISDISRNLKALAKELSVPIIALSQLNRSVESRTDKRPMMSDLRESGAIEQDADIIAFIYRDEVYNKDTTDKGVAEVILAKHRSGPIGVVRLAFSNEFTRFDNLEERDEYSAEYKETSFEPDPFA